MKIRLRTILLAVAVLGTFTPVQGLAFRANAMFWKPATVLVPFTWIGKGADANWSTAANWYGSAVPGASDIAIFDSDAATTCGANCSPTIDVPITVGGIKIKTGFGGTITQGAHAIAVGPSGWTMASGAFAGGSSNLTVYGDFILSGGSFTSTSAYLYFPGPFGATSTVSISSPTYFTHNSGWVSFGTSQYGNGSVVISASSVDFYNVVVARFNVDRGLTFSSSINAKGSLVFNSGGGPNGGSINAYSDITMTANGSDSTTVVNIMGAANQTLAGGGTAGVCPPIVIQKTAGTLTLTGTIVTAQNLTWTSGTVAAGTSTVQFGTPAYADGASTISLGTVHLNHVILNPYSIDRPQTIVGTLYADGDLTFDGGQGAVNSGTISVQGNVSFLSNHSSETTQLAFTGSGAQTVAVGGLGHPLAGSWTVSKSGGSLTLLNNVLIDSAAQSLSVVSGSIDMNGQNLTVGNILDLAGNTLTKNAGVLTVNGVVAGTGALFGGTVAP